MHLRNRVSTDAMMAHLSETAGHRQRQRRHSLVGTLAIRASVDIVNTAQQRFDVQTPEFSARVFKAEKGW